MSQEQQKCDIAYQYFKCAKPLDFSYRGLKSLEELNGNEAPLKLKARSAPKKCPLSKRYKTCSFWLNNNNLSSVNGLKNLAHRLFEVADYLSWLDLSGNNLTTISDEFQLFPNLTMLYLHGNDVKDIVEVYKLRNLEKLRTLTLKTNPMCLMCERYRSVVINLVPRVQKLDNVVVVRSERSPPKSTVISKSLLKRLSVAYPEDFAEPRR